MYDPVIGRLLAKAAASYASPSRPGHSSIYRDLLDAVDGENGRRVAQGLPRLGHPSYGDLVRRIRRLDPRDVHAARYGLAATVAQASERQS